MKSMTLNLVMSLMVLVLFVSCGGDGSGGGATDSSYSKNAEEQRALEQVGNEKIEEITDYEKEMEKYYYIVFGVKVQGVMNGEVQKVVTLNFTGKNKSDLLIANEHLDNYIERVEIFFNQYPEEKYFVLTRDEMKAKLELAHKLSKQFLDYIEHS